MAIHKKPGTAPKKSAKKAAPAKRSVASRPAPKKSSIKKPKPARASVTKSAKAKSALRLPADSAAHAELKIDGRMPAGWKPIPASDPSLAPARRTRAGGMLAAARRDNWRPAKSLLKLWKQVDAKFPGRRKGDDGMIGDSDHEKRSSDHNPWVDWDGSQGVVTALDITHDKAHGCDCNVLAEAIRGSKDSRVKYIIWNRRIANHAAIGGASAWAWRSYGGDNPHNKHMHISVKAERAKYDDESAWSI